MRNNTLKPKQLDEWLALLDNTKLPVPSGHKRRVENALANPRNSLGDIAKVISSAPSIALIFFREANKQRSTFSKPAQHLEAALTRLGMNHCKLLLSRLDDTPESEIHKPLRQLWLISQHANAQANALFATKLARLWQDIHWGSLLFLSPLWPLLTRHPELFKLWEQRVLGNKEPQHKVEHELFGTSLTLLCQALAERWSLPEWVIDAHRMLNQKRNLMVRTLRIAKLHAQPLKQQLLLDEQKDVFLWFRQPANTIILANGLAIDAHYSWAHEHCLRWQRFASMFLGWPLDKVQNQTHKIAVEHARELGKIDLWHPAQALLWPWTARRISRPKNGFQTQSINPKQLPPPSTEQLSDWQQQAQAMLQRPSPFVNHAQLLEAMAKMLETVDLTRIAMIAIPAKTQQLRPIYQQGFAFALHQPLTQTAQSPIMQKLLKKNAQIYAQDKNLAQLQAHLNQDITAAIDSSYFMMGALCLDYQPIMLLIADAQDRQLHANTLKVFNASCRYFEQALTIIRRRT
ncbi:MAG: HDOD domain-containing protein [Thiopseudomonas sp.]|nr:HDOD domain-containing protein [Thiopseudomonas sp.]MCK9464941.1 HDOD domain-containing protein [Thiopseudomonas sp.]